VNNSRGITFAYERPVYHARFGSNWQAAIAQAVRDMVDDLAANTSAGRLRAAATVAS
jgi:orotidine-5'-phosphate decarboxylase